MEHKHNRLFIAKLVSCDFSMTTSPTSFYKIVLFNGNCNDPKLRIPQKIVEKYGNELSEAVSLMVPTGGTWKVGLERKADQTVWLHGDGLFKFVQDNSINLGFFLLFQFHHSYFYVYIFDRSAMEIQNYYSTPSLRAHSPSFKVTMKLYHIRKTLAVRVPTDFTHQHLVPRPEFIKLVDTDENKEWEVRLAHYSKSMTYISKGWSTFVHDKELQVGDVCVFELMNHDNQNGKLRVNVLRANGK